METANVGGPAREQRLAALIAQREVAELAKRDREVRAHEQAHASVGGRHAGSPSYGYQRGPNGARYAVSGHVDIDMTEVPGDPGATLDKMLTVRRAALAPQNPSPQDRAVAAAAGRKAAEARAELASAATPGAPDPGAGRGPPPRQGTLGALLDVRA